MNIQPNFCWLAVDSRDEGHRHAEFEEPSVAKVANIEYRVNEYQSDLQLHIKLSRFMHNPLVHAKFRRSHSATEPAKTPATATPRTTHIPEQISLGT